MVVTVGFWEGNCKKHSILEIMVALQELFDKSRVRQEGPGQVHCRSSSDSPESAEKEARSLRQR